MDFYQEITALPLGELIRKYPVCADFLHSYGLDALPRQLPLEAALEHLQSNMLADMGLSAFELVDLLSELLEQEAEAGLSRVRSIEILGGTDKDGQPENVELRIRAGEVVSLVGPTGSGKSQLLADIECAARGDTPTGRRVLFDGREAIMASFNSGATQFQFIPTAILLIVLIDTP